MLLVCCYYFCCYRTTPTPTPIPTTFLVPTPTPTPPPRPRPPPTLTPSPARTRALNPRPTRTPSPKKDWWPRDTFFDPNNIFFLILVGIFLLILIIFFFLIPLPKFGAVCAFALRWWRPVTMFVPMRHGKPATSHCQQSVPPCGQRRNFPCTSWCVCHLSHLEGNQQQELYSLAAFFCIECFGINKWNCQFTGASCSVLVGCVWFVVPPVFWLLSHTGRGTLN